MATKTIVQLTDDLDPSVEATDTIRFALDNTDYEIDLSNDHINQLRSALDPYLKHARKVGGGRRGRAAAPLPALRRPPSGPRPGTEVGGRQRSRAEHQGPHRRQRARCLRRQGRRCPPSRYRAGEAVPGTSAGPDKGVLVPLTVEAVHR